MQDNQIVSTDHTYKLKSEQITFNYLAVGQKVGYYGKTLGRCAKARYLKDQRISPPSSTSFGLMVIVARLFVSTYNVR